MNENDTLTDDTNQTSITQGKTLNEVEWQTSSLKGNVVEGITKLKQQSGKAIQVLGSGDLVQTLMQHDLIDKYQHLTTLSRYLPLHSISKNAVLVDPRNAMSFTSKSPIEEP